MNQYELIDHNINYSLRKNGPIKREYLEVITEALDLVFSTPKTGIKPHLSVVVIDSDSIIDGDRGNKVSVGTYVRGAGVVLMAGRPLNNESDEAFIRQLRITVLNKLFHYVEDIMGNDVGIPYFITDEQEEMINSVCEALVDSKWYSAK